MFDFNRRRVSIKHHDGIKRRETSTLMPLKLCSIQRFRFRKPQWTEIERGTHGRRCILWNVRVVPEISCSLHQVLLPAT